MPRAVPRGSVAIVGAVPITTASFDHWLGIIANELGESEPAVQVHQQAAQRTVAFLVKAQWLLQEAIAEGADESKLNKLASEQAERSRRRGMTHTDAAFQARLNVIAEELQSRHSDAALVTKAQVAGYYAAHRSQFRNPAVRHTLMVVTTHRTNALRARAALASGQSWAAVAKHWSVDSSRLIGGGYAVVEGVQSPALVHATFAARPGQLTGPVRAAPAAQAGVADYYLFKVTGGQAGSPQPLTQAAAQIRQTLGEQGREHALAAFTRAYEQRWRSRTLCDPGYLVAECRNDPGVGGRGS